MNDLILVTGGTGTIGSHLLKFLKEYDATVRVFARDSKKALRLREQGYDVVLGDFDDRQSVDKALNGVQKVFLNSPAGPQQVAHQVAVVEGAISHGVGYIVKVSAMGAGPDSRLNMGRWHNEIEQAIRTSGIPYTFLQANGFMQNFFAYAHSIKDQGRIYAPMSHAKYSAVDACDVARTAARVLRGEGYENQTYVLTGPSAIDMRDVARAISTAINKEVRYVPISPEDAEKNMRSMGMPDWLVEDLSQLSRIYSENGASQVSQDISKLTGSRATDVSRFTQDNWKRFS